MCVLSVHFHCAGIKFKRRNHGSRSPAGIFAAQAHLQGLLVVIGARHCWHGKVRENHSINRANPTLDKRASYFMKFYA